MAQNKDLVAGAQTLLQENLSEKEISRARRLGKQDLEKTLGSWLEDPSFKLVFIPAIIGTMKRLEANIKSSLLNPLLRVTMFRKSFYVAPGRKS